MPKESLREYTIVQSYNVDHRGVALGMAKAYAMLNDIPNKVKSLVVAFEREPTSWENFNELASTPRALFNKYKPPKAKSWFDYALLGEKAIQNAFQENQNVEVVHLCFDLFQIIDAEAREETKNQKRKESLLSVAWATLQRGNALMDRGNIFEAQEPYDHESVVRNAQMFMNIFSADFIKQTDQYSWGFRPKHPKKKLIFITGLPRSGSSLIEQCWARTLQ